MRAAIYMARFWVAVVLTGARFLIQLRRMK